MQVRLYFDEDAMDSDLVRALRLRGVDVITANDLGLINTRDEEHLEYATANGRVLYSFNVRDYMSLHASYLAAGNEHAGLILAQQQRFSVGEQRERQQGDAETEVYGFEIPGYRWAIQDRYE